MVVLIVTGLSFLNFAFGFMAIFGPFLSTRTVIINCILINRDKCV